MKRKLLFAFVLLAFSLFSFAQEGGWTLDDCIRYALENNITLKRQELATDLNKADLTQSKLNALPNLNGQAQHNMGSGRLLDEGTYEWVNTDLRQGNLGLASNVSLFRGLTGYNTVKMMQANYLASSENLELFENNLLIQILTGYLDLLRKMELFEIAKEKVRITELQVERMTMLMDLGNASAGDLLEVKSQASAEKYNMTLSKNQVDVAKLALVHFLNLSDGEGFEITMPEIPDPNLLQIPDMDLVYQTAVSVLPQIKSAEYTIDYFQKNLAVSRGELSPEIFARAYYNSNYNNLLPNISNPTEDYTFDQQILDHRYSQLSVGITVPIFNRWQGRTNISKAKINLQDARYGLQDAKQELLKDIQQYYTDAVAAFDNYEAARESNANSEEAYRYAEEKFKVGMATALELEEARNRLFASRAEMVSSKYVFALYLKILDFYQGKDISIS
ncbi:MAG: TolC family protein [Bacteroidales bacterium]|jgi:outer membrane protein|nr:TolC family protein [Bacteroidales bacterium]